MGKASRRKAVVRTRELLNSTQSRLKALGVKQPMVIRSDLPQEQKISNGICKSSTAKSVRMRRWTNTAIG